MQKTIHFLIIGLILLFNPFTQAQDIIPVREQLEWTYNYGAVQSIFSNQYFQDNSALRTYFFVALAKEKQCAFGLDYETCSVDNAKRKYPELFQFSTNDVYQNNLKRLIANAIHVGHAMLSLKVNLDLKNARTFYAGTEKEHEPKYQRCLDDIIVLYQSAEIMGRENNASSSETIISISDQEKAKYFEPLLESVSKYCGQDILAN